MWYVLFCRVCDPELEMPMPFETPQDRGRWAAEHRRGTGHDEWLVIEEARVLHVDTPEPPHWWRVL